MNNLKIGVLLAALLLVLTFSASAFAAPSDWAESEVNLARAADLLVSGADRNYQSNISRALFCKLIVQMVEKQGGEVVITTANPFIDTANAAVIKAHQLGIVKGVSANRFAPDNLITRQEVAVMMMRTFRVLDSRNGTDKAQKVLTDGLTFTDQSRIASWALQDIKQAYKLGIVKGVGGNKIDPLGNTTIEQSILLSLRLYNRYGAAAVTKPTATTEATTARPTEPTTTRRLEAATTVSAETNRTTEKITTTAAASTSATTTKTTTKTTPTTKPASTTPATTQSKSTTTQSTGADADPDVKPVVQKAPLAKSSELVINVRNGLPLVIHPADVANDVNGDEMQFVGTVDVIKTPKTNLAAVDFESLQLDKSGNLVIHPADSDENIDKFGFIGLQLTDNKTDPIDVKVLVRVVASGNKPIVNFMPAILNVNIGQTVEQSIYKYIDARPHEVVIQSIVPAGETDFGELVAASSRGVNVVPTLKFIGSSDASNIDKYQTYQVTVRNLFDSVSFDLIVKYGDKTFDAADARSTEGEMEILTTGGFPVWESEKSDSSLEDISDALKQLETINQLETTKAKPNTIPPLDLKRGGRR